MDVAGRFLGSEDFRSEYEYMWDAWKEFHRATGLRLASGFDVSMEEAIEEKCARRGLDDADD